MRKPRSALILFVQLVLSLVLAIPPEDVLETTYDEESETQPYEAIPFFFSLSPLAASGAPKAVLNAVRVPSGSLLRFAATRINDTGAHRSSQGLAPVPFRA
jgi:hypothetical protein